MALCARNERMSMYEGEGSGNETSSFDKNVATSAAPSKPAAAQPAAPSQSRRISSTPIPVFRGACLFMGL